MNPIAQEIISKINQAYCDLLPIIRGIRTVLHVLDTALAFLEGMNTDGNENGD